jgi:hypothetical protein
MACKLPPDAWALIGLHLKPRHIALLIRTSTKIKHLVDNEAYWTRVAFHMVWRKEELLETWDHTERKVLTPMNENLYDMLALDRGYYQGMELFIKRVDEAIDYWSKHVSEEYRWEWDKFKTMSLKEKILEQMKRNYEVEHHRTIPVDELEKTMKEVAKEHILQSLRILVSTVDENDKAYNAFVLDLEDDPMPAKYKRRIMDKVRTLLWESWKPDCDVCPTDIAQGICKFGVP